MIKYDNTALQRKVMHCFEDGENKFNKGKNISEKEQGIQLMIQGLQTIQTWISRNHFTQAKTEKK
jgi:hypothetical protein